MRNGHDPDQTPVDAFSPLQHLSNTIERHEKADEARFDEVLDTLTSMNRDRWMLRGAMVVIVALLAGAPWIIARSVEAKLIEHRVLTSK